MQFCGNCNNLLYPKEDRVQKRLLYACRHCEFAQPADPSQNGLVHTNELKKAPTATFTISKEIIVDPTLRRIKGQKTCPKCSFDEMVYFNSAENRLDLTYVCCNPQCTYYWSDAQL